MSGLSVPRFGPLSGIKVIVIGVSTAGPYAASIMADESQTGHLSCNRIRVNRRSRISEQRLL
jgi:hypothetical protein